MTVEFLIYAVGGGHGHARRGLLLQQHLAQRGIGSVILLRPGSDRHFPVSYGPRQYALGIDDPKLVSLLDKPPPRLIVDTFPQGWQGEMSNRLLAHFESTYWMARYAKTVDMHQPAFGRTLLPYPKGREEWGSHSATAIHTGYIVDASHWRIGTAKRLLAVFDPEGRCGGRLISAFSRAAKKTGLNLAYHRLIDRPMEAAKLLVVGAGYNTFYELLGLAMDIRFLPVMKRHDDQFRRANLFGLGLTHLDQLLPWLDAVSPSRIDYAEPDWSAVASALEV